MTCLSPQPEPNSTQSILDHLASGHYIAVSKEGKFEYPANKTERHAAAKRGYSSKLKDVICAINRYVDSKEHPKVLDAIRLRVKIFADKALSPKTFWGRLMLVFQRRKIEDFVHQALKLISTKLQKEPLHLNLNAPGQILVFNTKTQQLESIDPSKSDAEKGYLFGEEMRAEVFNHYFLTPSQINDLLRNNPDQKTAQSDVSKTFMQHIAGSLYYAEHSEDTLGVLNFYLELLQDARLTSEDITQSFLRSEAFKKLPKNMQEAINKGQKIDAIIQKYFSEEADLKIKAIKQMVQKNKNVNELKPHLDEAIAFLRVYCPDKFDLIEKLKALQLLLNDQPQLVLIGEIRPNTKEIQRYLATNMQSVTGRTDLTDESFKYELNKEPFQIGILSDGNINERFEIRFVDCVKELGIFGIIIEEAHA